MESESTPMPKSQKPYGSAETFEEHRQKTLLHLVKMASTPGFKRYTWHEVQRLENNVYGYYRGIQEEFLQKVKENQ